jgi:hypothetical protein
LPKEQKESAHKNGTGHKIRFALNFVFVFVQFL